MCSILYCFNHLLHNDFSHHPLLATAAVAVVRVGRVPVAVQHKCVATFRLFHRKTVVAVLVVLVPNAAIAPTAATTADQRREALEEFCVSILAVCTRRRITGRTIL